MSGWVARAARGASLWPLEWHQEALSRSVDKPGFDALLKRKDAAPIK